MVDVIIAIHNLYVLRAHHYSWQSVFLTVAYDGLCLFTRNDILTYRLVTVRTHGTGGKDISVHQMLYWSHVIEQLAGTSRSREYLYAAFMCKAQRLAGRLWYVVRIEADERSVHIEKQCFNHIFSFLLSLMLLSFLCFCAGLSCQHG